MWFYFIFLVWGSYDVALGFVYFLRENLKLDGKEGKENVEGLEGGEDIIKIHLELKIERHNVSSFCLAENIE